MLGVSILSFAICGNGERGIDGWLGSMSGGGGSAACARVGSARLGGVGGIPGAIRFVDLRPDVRGPDRVVPPLVVYVQREVALVHDAHGHLLRLHGWVVVATAAVVASRGIALAVWGETRRGGKRKIRR